MTFQGSKERYNKYIVPLIQQCINNNNISTFIDCCCGGCNIIKHIKAPQRIAIDNDPYLIALWQFLQENPNYEFPLYPSKEIWDNCKSHREAEDWFIGLVSIFCSNLAGGFPAGYDKTGSRYNGRIKHCKADLPLLKDVKFICNDYHYLSNFNNCVIYIDPPYVKRHQYNYEIFNTQEFWKFSREISKNNYVFISEQEAPDDFQSIWSITSERNMRGKTSILTENLYTYTQGLTKI